MTGDLLHCDFVGKLNTQCIVCVGAVCKSYLMETNRQEFDLGKFYKRELFSNIIEGQRKQSEIDLRCDHSRGSKRIQFDNKMWRQRYCLKKVKIINNR